MIFNEIMALIMPNIISLHFYTKLTKKVLNIFNIFCLFCLICLTTNCICYAILVYINGTPTFDFSTVFTIKYCSMATIIALIISFLYRILELNLQIELVISGSKNEKK